MFRINKLTDYAVMLLVRFARQGGGREEVCTAHELTEQTRLPLPTVVKVLKMLAREGLLSSTRGIKGGYRLSRPAVQITMADIVIAMEGPLAITECNLGPCEYEASCPTRPHWHQINGAIARALSGLTLQEMACPLPSGIPLWVAHARPDAPQGIDAPKEFAR